MTPCSVVQFHNECDMLAVELTVNTHCTTLQHIATHRNTLQHTATHCNTPQHTATHCNTPFAQLRNERDILSVELCGLRQQMSSRDLQIAEFQKGCTTHEARARAKDSEIEELRTQLTQLSSAEVRTELEARYTATHCNTLQHAATRCNTLHHAVPRCTALHTAAYCNILQHAATQCNTLQHYAMRRCSVLQRVAACCNAMRRGLG